MTRNSLMIFFGILSLSAYSQKDITGIWDNSKKHIQIEIFIEGNSLCAKVKSSENPDYKQGELIVKELTWSKHKWKGLMYSSKKDEWFKVEAKSSNQFLYIKDFSDFLTKSQTWKKL